MTAPENTTKRDPLLHLAGSWDDPSAYIAEMEAAGQAQVVASTTLPTEAPWDELTALGFVRGEEVAGDALFTHAQLPAGWTRAATGHAMYSSVLDERGIARVSVGYKAAFYDRWARAHVVHPGWSLATDAIYGDDAPALPREWEVLTDAERADFQDSLHAQVTRYVECPDVYGDRHPRVQKLLELVVLDGEARR